MFTELIKNLYNNGKCPKCGHKLRMIDGFITCPNCCWGLCGRHQTKYN